MAVKEDGGLAQPGEIGELHVRGATVMVGYWGGPERTARGLGADPSRSTHTGPVYRTGDLVELQADGAYRYVGRRDAQVKSRAYRIELGDVEAAINLLPGVVECAVVAVADELVTNRLVAHATVRDNSTESDQSERLPVYMIPESFTLLTELPNTSTGKVDRRSLLARAEG